MFERLVRYLVMRAGRDYSVTYRAIATLLGATLFLAGWPALVSFSGELLPTAISSQRIATLLGTAFFLVGVPWTVWAVVWQLFRGRGTPVPVVPTKFFLQSGSYQYTRNPMMFGYFFYLLGWTALFNKAGSVVCSMVLISVLIAQIKLIEEKELQERFGDAYRRYKSQTPFLFPRLK